MAWKTLGNWLSHLEQNDELIRIKEPVQITYETFGAIADLLVKNEGLLSFLKNRFYRTGQYQRYR